MNLAEAAADKLRQVGPWPGFQIPLEAVLNLMVAVSGSGMGVIAGSEQGRMSAAAAIVGIGFPILCLGWGMAANNPELLQGAAIEFGGFVAGYLGMALARRRR